MHLAELNNSIEHCDQLSGSLASASSGKEATVLTDIYRAEVNMAIWQRSLDQKLLDYSQQLAVNCPELQMRLVGTPDSIAAQLAENLPTVNEAADGHQLLVSDIVHVVEMFSCLFELKQVGLRLAVLRKAMCPKFHVDRVPCRLLCTYTGEGTHWHLAENIEINSEIIGKHKVRSVNPKDASQQQQLNVGEVALLKGEEWLGNEGRGLVHRSPPASNNSPRLVLTLDFA